MKELKSLFSPRTSSWLPGENSLDEGCEFSESGWLDLYKLSAKARCDEHAFVLQSCVVRGRLLGVCRVVAD